VSPHSFRQLDEIAFSLDGYSSETNDPLRGKGTFDRCVDALRHAINLSYKVTITCCVQKLFLEPRQQWPVEIGGNDPIR
jgi:MoaA/NifB/PqqE/SkfB family radical SAM enzyme